MTTSKRWIAAIAVVALMASGTIGVLALVGDDGDNPVQERDPIETTRAEPGVPQARWSVRSFPAGTVGRGRATAKKAVARNRDALARAVTTVIDTLILAPESLRDLSGGPLSRRAAKALSRSPLPLPDKVDGVQTLVRRARIGLDANGAGRAAAAVTVRLKADVEGKRVRLLHRSNLYLEQHKKRWQVIGFDGTRRRLR